MMQEKILRLLRALQSFVNAENQTRRYLFNVYSAISAVRNISILS